MKYRKNYSDSVKFTLALQLVVHFEVCPLYIHFINLVTYFLLKRAYITNENLEFSILAAKVEASSRTIFFHLAMFLRDLDIHYILFILSLTEQI